MNAPFTPCRQVCLCGCCRPCRPWPTPGSGVLRGDFQEHIELLQASDGQGFSETLETEQAETVTVFVKNLGSGPLAAFLQNSPDGADFVNDPKLLELESGQIGYLVPYIFSKYIRAAIQSEGGGTAQIWFQIQNRSYTQYWD